MTTFTLAGATAHCEHDPCAREFAFPSIGRGAIDFKAGTEAMRAEGWLVWIEYGTWHHLCNFHKGDKKS